MRIYLAITGAPVMKSAESRLLRKQLDAKLRTIRKVAEEPPPVKGWIRSIREALAMNARQFAGRMDVSPSRVSELEEAERTGGVTINSMRRAAEALNCRFVYFLLPEHSLEETLEVQIDRHLRKKFLRVGQTMMLEEQDLTYRAESLLYRTMREDFLYDPPKAIWEEE
jgi:predicted DNA-binding mobile mystery protein A